MTPRPRTSTPFLIHLTGPQQGAAHPLRAGRLEVGTSAEAAIHFPSAETPAVRERHAVFERGERGYQVEAVGDATLRVNGVRIRRHELSPGDLLELGEEGPLLRYRLHEESGTLYKSIAEALHDCIDCARQRSDTRWGRLRLLLAGMPRELLTQTAPWTRTAILVLLVGLVTGVALLAARTWSLERRLEAEGARLEAAARMLEEAERDRLTAVELERIRQDLAADLSARVEALEARGEAVPAVISAASRSVAFIQGAYGFLDPATGEPLRSVLGPAGRPLADRRGQPIVTREPDGPVLELLFTGTAFVIGRDGLLLTNRHLARPWEFDASARAAVARGLLPTMRRMLGYFPHQAEPVLVEPVLASESADLALLRARGALEAAAPLELAPAAARPGQEVVVLGYPTGIRALLARTNPGFVDSLMREPSLDAWAVARRLATAQHIAPLATRGIVGQTTEAFVVYDAETTRGGSGGPVLSLDGGVLAVTVGILPEFGGSNLGVPAEQAQRLLEQLSEPAPGEPAPATPTGEPESR